MKCHAGVEFPSGTPCPKCNAKLGEVCWPGINADLLEMARLRDENEQLRRDLSHAKAVQEVWIGRARRLEAALPPAQSHPIEIVNAGQSFRKPDLAGKIER